MKNHPLNEHTEPWNPPGETKPPNRLELTDKWWSRVDPSIRGLTDAMGLLLATLTDDQLAALTDDEYEE